MYRKGFTLVELSIVIVIIGLIVASIVGGQSLTNQSKIRATIAEVDKVRVAFTAFKTEYNQYPGNMRNAQSYWGPTVYNGNGDRFLANNRIWFAPENLAAWEHLAMAKLIEGTYTGEFGTGIKIGENTPKIPYSNNTSFYFYGSGIHGRYPAVPTLAFSGILLEGHNDYKIKVTDAQSIDLKIDDAKPYRGHVITYNNNDGECVPAGSRLATVLDLNTVEYQLSDKSDLCTMHFSLVKSF